MESMAQRIKEIRGEKTAAEILELNLDSCKSNGEPEGLEEYESLVKLSMNCVGLNCLKNFPKLLKLTKLELSDNHIAGSLSNLKQCQSLTHLNLSNNKIATVDALEPLADLKKLVSLDLFHCSVTETKDYRSRVYSMLPSLKYLDGFDLDGVEKTESEEEDDEDDEEEEKNGHGDAAVSKNGKNGDAAGDVNNDDEEDDDFDSGDDSEEEEGSEDDDDDEEVGLEYLTKDIGAEDEEDDGDYEGEELDDDEDDDDDINDSDDGDLDSSDARGVKRKREDEDGEEE